MPSVIAISCICAVTLAKACFSSENAFYHRYDTTIRSHLSPLSLPLILFYLE